MRKEFNSQTPRRHVKPLYSGTKFSSPECCVPSPHHHPIWPRPWTDRFAHVDGKQPLLFKPHWDYITNFKYERKTEMISTKKSSFCKWPIAIVATSFSSEIPIQVLNILLVQYFICYICRPFCSLGTIIANSQEELWKGC